ncbi:MAG: dTMP kinase [Gammaproteobacteria bacterium]|nr:dTMP kinase [Gammaproteobacteria bacterium]MCH9717578.1 dTMP kinase [Gammaproteobacteria bacterium]MCH9762669.1 dTMP kinase [Gammaproteobacteria bacterium]
MATQPGQFIVLEGLEGAGKSTALTTIKRFISPYVPELIITREPGGTHVGETVRELVKHAPEEEPLLARSELLLFYAARIQLIEQVIRPALARGAWVLADRFELSTWAYQGGGRELDKTIIQALSDFSVQNIRPDLILFLDLPPEQGLQRILERGHIDRIEQEPLDFFNRVYATYHEKLQTLEQAVLIDASKPLAMVQHLIRTTLEHHLVSHDIELIQ